MSDPLILITNDDGYDAPGLVALFEAVRDLGDVRVVAPRRERSACSHMITMHESIVVEHIRHEPFGEVFTVTGTPADCVRLAAVEILPRRPDLVLSGINRGANAGVDVYYSGTVAAAREGAILGLPSIALSHAVRNGQSLNWSAASRVAAHLVGLLREWRLPCPGFWSVNLPPVIPEDFRSRLHFVPASIVPMPLDFERVDHPDGRTTEFRYGAYYWDRETHQNEDFTVIRNGGIAISAIALAAPIRIEHDAAG